MRRMTLVIIFGVLLTSVTAHADPINIGFISFDNFIPAGGGVAGVNGFTINNFTGNPAAGGFALPPDFPVFTPLSLANSVMSVVIGGVISNIALGSFAPGIFQPGSLQF